MTELVLQDISDETWSELQRSAQQNRRSAAEEAAAIVEETMLRLKYQRITKEQGLGAALQEIGRQFEITTEFDNLRDRMSGSAPAS